MSYYDYDPNDIALSIQKAIDERADPAAVSYLLMERNKKISDNPQYAGYRNDVITRQAEDYIAKYSPASTQDLDMLYEARRDLAIRDAVKLDGGGSFILHNGNFVVSTPENRRIHNIGIWEG